MIVDPRTGTQGRIHSESLTEISQKKQNTDRRDTPKPITAPPRRSLTFHAVRVQLLLRVYDPAVETVLPPVEQRRHHLVEGRRMLVRTGLQHVAVHYPAVVLPLVTRPTDREICHMGQRPAVCGTGLRQAPVEQQQKCRSHYFTLCSHYILQYNDFLGALQSADEKWHQIEHHTSSSGYRNQRETGAKRGLK